MTEFERSHEHPVGIGKVIKPADLHFDHIVHEMDIRRPLGLLSQWNTDDMRAALLALCGRPTGLADLQGDGCAELTARISR